MYWISRGKKRQETKILKGYQLVKPKVLKKLVIKSGASNINIAGIPLPKNAECEHMMITGTTGAGKTNAINSLLVLVSAYVDPATEKTAMGIRATLVSALRNLNYLEDNNNDFSIRNWLKNEDKNWLFISSLPTQRETLKPLMTAWLSIAVKSIMSMGEDINRRIWIIIDELASLNKVPVLMQGLSEIRKYGGCFVLSFQDLNQLHAIYGQHIARTFGSLTGTKLVFRMDSHGAKQMADLFGEQEVLEPNESISFGAHQMREGVSLTDHQKVRPLISPADLMKLDNLEAYLKFPRNLPATKVLFDFNI